MTSHEIDINEWSRQTVNVGPPSPDDLDLEARLNSDLERKLELRWLRDGRLDIRTTSWIGVLRLSNVTIRIRPKYAGNELGVLRMLSYASGYEALRPTDAARSLSDQGADLFDLIAFLLGQEVNVISREGVIHDYTVEEASLPALRGTLRFREQLTRRFGQLDQIECRYDEFHADVLDNRLLRAGISTGVGLSRDHCVKRLMRRFDMMLAELCEVGPFDPSFYRERLHYTRRNERYRSAHELALLLLESSGVDDLYRQDKTKSFAFLLDMNVIFEAFVTRLIEDAFTASSWKANSQQRDRTVIRDRSTGRNYSAIIPDVVLDNGHDRVPFDCKYKLYGSAKKISSADIYQTFLYAYAISKFDDSRRAGVIYPSTHTSTAPHLEVGHVGSSASAQIIGVAIDLLAIQRALGDKIEWHARLDDIRHVLADILHPVSP